MAAVCGKWQLCSSENFDAYMLDIGTTPENLEKAKMALSESSGLVQEISGSGTAWTLKTVTKFGERCNDFTLGQAIDTKTLDERPVKVTLTVEGDSLVETVQGADFQSKNVRTASGDTLTMVMTSGNGVTATRKYKKVG